MFTLLIMPQRLSLEVKLKLVNDLKDQHLSVSEAARRFDLSRAIIYKWIKKYKNRRRSRDMGLGSRVKQADAHWKSLGFELEQELVKLVIKHPECTLREYREKVNYRRIEKVSLHVVWNILNGHRLTTLNDRKRYADIRKGRVVLETAAEVKLKAVKEVLEDHKTVVEVAKEFLVSRQVVSK